MFRPISWLAHFISATGAINWGLVRFFNFNLVEYTSNAAKIAQLNDLIYALITICGIFSILALFTPRKCSE